MALAEWPRVGPLDLDATGHDDSVPGGPAGSGSPGVDSTGRSSTLRRLRTDRSSVPSRMVVSNDAGRVDRDPPGGTSSTTLASISTWPPYSARPTRLCPSSNQYRSAYRTTSIGGRI